jgi:hypothetical protein
MPKPNKGEDRGSFIQRAVQTIKAEEPQKTMKQVLGKAYGLLEQGKKKGGKK